MKMLEIKKLYKDYGNHIAVDGIDLKIEKGQIYGILGPNGAGKSTTIGMICGLIKLLHIKKKLELYADALISFLYLYLILIMSIICTYHLIRSI